MKIVHTALIYTLMTLCKVILCVVAAKSADKQAQRQQTILKGIHAAMDIGNFDGKYALTLLDKLQDRTLLREPISGVSLTQHLLTAITYQTDSSRPDYEPGMTVKETKDIIVQVLMKVLEYGVGIDVEMGSIEQAIRLRDINLAITLARRSYRVDNMAQTAPYYMFDPSHIPVTDIANVFRQLYTLPCQSTRMSKRFLQAANYMYQNTDNNTEDSLDKFYDSLRSQPGGSLRLDALSEQLLLYSDMVNASLVPALNSIHSTGQYYHIDLSTMINAIDQVMVMIHRELLRPFMSHNIAVSVAADGDGLQSVEEDKIRMNKLIIFTAALNDRDDQYGRTVLHHLCASGAGNMMGDLLDTVTALRSLSRSKDEDNSLLSETAWKDVYDRFDRYLIQALNAVDKRGQKPFKYAAVYGEDSKIFQSTKSLYSLFGYKLEDESVVVNTFLASKPSNSSTNEAKTVSMDSTSPTKKKAPQKAMNWDDKRISYPKSNRHVTNPSSVIDSDRCDIEEVPPGQVPTMKEFFENYVLQSKPVIFRGVNTKSSDIRTLFTKETYLRLFGHDVLPLTSIPYAGAFGLNTTATNSDIVSKLSAIDWKSLTPTSLDELSYIFHATDGNFDAKLRQYLSLPSMIRDIPVYDEKTTLIPSMVTMQFYLGPAGSGSPMHYHGHALNSLAYGEKKWFIHPPSEAYYSSTPIAKFVLFDRRATEARTCTQHAGDILYIPTMWSHAILNTKQSIGMTFEFPQGIFCSE